MSGKAEFNPYLFLADWQEHYKFKGHFMKMIVLSSVYIQTGYSFAFQSAISHPMLQY